MDDKELKAAIKALGGDLRGLRGMEALEKRLKQLEKKAKSIPEYESVQGNYPQPVGRVSVLPDEPPAIQPINAFSATLGMTQAVPLVQKPFGSLSQQQIMDATARHRQQGMQVSFVENCWEFWVLNQQGRKGRMDSGNMSLPLKVVIERADFVAMGRPLPIVNPVIVPTPNGAMAE